jgi:hypothetical protein
MEFDQFDLFVKDLSMWNVIIRCNNSGPLYTMHLPSHPASSSLGNEVSTILVLTSCLSCPRILVLFAIGTLVTFAMIAS